MKTVFLTILCGFLIAPALIAQPGLTRLDAWYSTGRRDALTTSDPAWIGSLGETRLPDYAFSRVEGRVFSPDLPQPPTTLGLYRWFSPSRGDNYTTTHPSWIGTPGDTRAPDYTFSRMEGYVFDRPLAGTIPLKGWYYPGGEDNYATCLDPIWGNNTSYSFTRIDGYMLPPTNNQPTFSAEFFGYGTMRQRGARAIGTRPLLIILAEFSDIRFRSPYTQEYYRNLFFGSAPPSVARYYLWNSYFNLLWTEAAILKVSVPDDPATSRYDESLYATWNRADVGDPMIHTGAEFSKRVLAEAAKTFDFAPYDDNADGRVTPDELGVFLINSDPPGADCGQTRGNNALTVDGVSIEVFGSVVSQGVGFATLCHELGHQIGTLDLYGGGYRLNYAFSPMAATCEGERVHRYYHLDAWHKMRLGWIEPRIFNLTYPGACAYLDAPQRGGWNATENKRPILLFDPARQRNKIKEFFLIEYRTRTLPIDDAYDADVKGTGIVIWWIRTGTSSDDLIAFQEIWDSGNGLDSSIAPGSDDQAVDWDLDGAIDTIVPGTDFILQSTATPDDVVRADPTCMVYGGPSQRWGFGNPWRPGDIATTLRYFDGTDSGFRVRFGSNSPDGQTSSVEWNMDNILADDIPPRLDELLVPSLPRAPIGTTITVSGMFGVSSAGMRTLTLNRGSANHDLIVTQWSPDRVSAQIPLGVPTGDYRLMCYADAAHTIPGNWLPFRITALAHLDLTRVTPGNEMRIALKADENSIYVLEAAKDVNGPWEPIYTNKAPFTFVLPPLEKHPRQFFRAMEFDQASQ